MGKRKRLAEALEEDDISDQEGTLLLSAGVGPSPLPGRWVLKEAPGPCGVLRAAQGPGLSPHQHGTLSVAGLGAFQQAPLLILMHPEVGEQPSMSTWWLWGHCPPRMLGPLEMAFPEG